jgi:sigma-E factor negative regulatory protein RseA
MSENKDQSRQEFLSCLMDGELGDSKQTMEQLSRCGEAKSFWLNCHIIRDAIRDSQPSRLPHNFSERVMQALESEPVIFSPGAMRRLRVLKPVAGLAIAASVAAVTVFGIRAYYMPDGQQTTGQFAATSSVQTVPAESVTLAQSPSQQPAAPSKYDDELNAYVLGHMEHAAAGRVQGMMPYVRLTEFEDSQ